MASNKSIQSTIRGMLKDWNNATPAQRKAASKSASKRAKKAGKKKR